MAQWAKLIKTIIFYLPYNNIKYGLYKNIVSETENA